MSGADLTELLAAADPASAPAQRHLQLIALLDWVRGDEQSADEAVARVARLVDALDAAPEDEKRLRAWWSVIFHTMDMTTLLADFGFAQRTSMLSELADRLRAKLLPVSPDTLDASELFMLALPSEFDARWLAALGEPLLARLQALMAPDGEDGGGASHWRRTLLDAITYCAGQILANGFSPELRLRMSHEARAEQPFHALLRDSEALRIEVLHPLRTDDRLQQAAAQLREHLDGCRGATNTVYNHIEESGISVGLVFRLRQLRLRIVRVRSLLECVLSERAPAATVKLLVRLVQVGIERRSLRAVLASNSQLLAAKVAERSAETGEHYITRTGAEYLAMVRAAAGGGAVMGFTTLLKFALMALPLSAFWGGLAAGINYAASFVLIQLLHFTIATKQPAMTAPAMAASLKELDGDEAVQDFADKVTWLVRSQVAAVLGNVLLVFPAGFALAWLWQRATGTTAISAGHALETLDSLSLLGPSLLFAAFTGVLLFASSIIAGWVENWFVLRRLDSAIQYNPRITNALGKQRAARWAKYLRENISGFASNSSLGFMLGLAPAFAGFFGLGMEVRHVTLTSGQIGVASAVLGPDALHLAALWWAVAMVPFNGAVNVLVSFYMAFRLALRAHNVSGVDRARIYAALRQRLRHVPLSFFIPSRTRR